MTVPRKGSRRIVVDGETFLWRVRSRPTYSQGLAWAPLTACVQREGSKNVLVLVFAGARPDNWVGEAIVVATPSKVAIGIRNAIKSGWAADGRGTTFYAIASGQLGKSEPHVTGRGLDATPTSGEAAYDPSWLVQLARAQCPELTWLPSALQKCTKLDRAERAYLYFVNPKSTQWRFDYNIFLESPEHGRLILDILKQELVGGVEFLNRI